MAGRVGSRLIGCGFSLGLSGNRYYGKLDYRSVRALVSVVASVRATHLEVDIEKNRKGSPNHENQEEKRVSDVTSRVCYEADNEWAQKGRGLVERLAGCKVRGGEAHLVSNREEAVPASFFAWWYEFRIEGTSVTLESPVHRAWQRVSHILGIGEMETHRKRQPRRTSHPG